MEKRTETDNFEHKKRKLHIDIVEVIGSSPTNPTTPEALILLGFGVFCFPISGTQLSVDPNF